ncbi:MAG: MFS transporter, partial [Longicatena sp.]
MKQLLDVYITLKTQKQYLKIILANSINRFGDSIDAIAFTWLVYEVTQSATWSTVIFGMNMLPTILLQPFTGALVENMRKKNIMIICDIARGVSVSIIAISYLAGNLTPWMILAVTLLDSTFETFRIPAGISIVPKLLDEEHYEVGTALNSTFSRAMELIGTGCAGFIIGIFGISTAIFIDA